MAKNIINVVFYLSRNTGHIKREGTACFHNNGTPRYFHARVSNANQRLYVPDRHVDTALETDEQYTRLSIIIIFPLSGGPVNYLGIQSHLSLFCW